jgi:hypothetical protein
MHPDEGDRPWNLREEVRRGHTVARLLRAESDVLALAHDALNGLPPEDRDKLHLAATLLGEVSVRRGTPSPD